MGQRPSPRQFHYELGFTRVPDLDVKTEFGHAAFPLRIPGHLEMQNKLDPLAVMATGSLSTDFAF
jgi:hypothetical protein